MNLDVKFPPLIKGVGGILSKASPDPLCFRTELNDGVLKVGTFRNVREDRPDQVLAVTVFYGLYFSNNMTAFCPPNAKLFFKAF
jgi:hypothetical protein